QLPNHERELTSLLASTNSVVSFVPGKTDYSGKHEPMRMAEIDPQGSDPRHYMTRQDTWRPTLRLFEAAAKGNGATLPAGTRGSSVRGLPMLVDLGGTLYPSNVLEALRVSAGGTGYI